jgi:1,4-dihydroxy-2-naphthoate octaprenyltransferase
MRRFLNYLGQLRVYSFADLLLLLLATHARTRDIAIVSMLWFGFLIHLEWRHRDRGRARWPWYAWVIPWCVATVAEPRPLVIVFFSLAAAYSLKKRWQQISWCSPLLNGALKATLIILVPHVSLARVTLVFVAMSVRNLLGDIRDAEKDAREGVASLPIVLGYRTATPWIYPLGLAATSCLWTAIGHLPSWYLGLALTAEVLTYHLTPR